MRAAQVCVCVFAKAPRAGEVKTRLAEAIGPERAAALAGAFLEDTLALVGRLPWARPVYATDEVRRSAGSPGPGGEVWLQEGGDPGERLEGVLRRAVAATGRGIVLAADVPGLAAGPLEQAAAALEQEEAVLGPCGDGGFYLVGAHRCPQGLIAGLPWSTARTLERMRERFAAHAMNHRLVEPWDDVDSPDDLRRLAARLARGELAAPATARMLNALGLAAESQSAASGPGRG